MEERASWAVRTKELIVVLVVAQMPQQTTSFCRALDR